MVTLQSVGGRANMNVLHIVGLSTDVKPTNAIESMGITNGSTFEEIDTGNIYRYNYSASTWILKPNS